MKITMKDAIRNVERPDTTPENIYLFEAPVDDIAQELGLQSFYCYPDELDLRLREYPIAKWLCTDTHVGLSALYLDGEPVGSIYQSARKNGKEFRWLSQECADRTRTILVSYMAEENHPSLLVTDEEMDDTFVVAYVEQLLADEGYFEGRPVKVLVKYSTYHDTPDEYRRPDRPYYEKVQRGSAKDECLKVYDGNEEFIIPVHEFEIPLLLKKVDE